MLGIEKVSKKKLIIYFIIISAMISGSVFFIYQNYKITSGAMLDSTIVGIDISSFEEVSSNARKAVKPLDISVLNSSKFKALKEIIDREAEIEVGRDNPFENPFNLSNK